MAHLNLTEKPSEELLLDSSEKEIAYYINDEEKPLTLFGPIQNVNIFVGANNSGKSRFMRGVIKHPSYAIIDVNFFDSVSKLILEEFRMIDDIENFEESGVIISIYPRSIINNSGAAITQNFSQLSILSNNNGTINEPIIINFVKSYFIGKLTDIKNWTVRILNEKDKEKFKIFIYEVQLELKCVVDTFIHYGNHGDRTSGPIQTKNISLLDGYTDSITNIVEYLETLKEDRLYRFDAKVQKIYIPILRTASSLYNFHTDATAGAIQKISNDVFKFSVIKNYNFKIEKTPLIKIQTGLDLYKSIRLIRNNKKAIRKEFEDFEYFIGQSFFNGDTVDIVAKEEELKDKNEEHIIIHFGLEGGDRNIHDLGDGIQSLIIMMYPIFTAEKGAWIFIEEPEINLHPGLQRIFLEQITSNPAITEKGLTFFITTHSNNLLDLTLEQEKNGISIFTFQKEMLGDKNIKRIRNVLSGDTDILKLLGVNNSSVFMANCSIWVEGHTDRLYLKAYLKAYIEHEGLGNIYKEDLHYAFFEYAGSNLSHYLFIDKNEIDVPEDIEYIQAQFLSNRIFLLADRDKGKESKHALFTNMESKNFTYYVLKSREIENLISPKKLKELILHFSKGKIKSNLPRLININAASYKNKYLGEFLKEKFKDELPKSLWTAKSKSISPLYKKNIVDFVTKDLKWEDMSKEAQTLAKDVYSFIESNNK